jgi:hypothetical protein
MDKQNSIVCICHILFIYSVIDGHLGYSTYGLLQIMLLINVYKQNGNVGSYDKFYF